MLNLLIENFKSIDRLDLELGRVNLFIGENGCGKSNILEAVGIAAAAANFDLSNGSLKARGIRVTDPPSMRSAFDGKTRDDSIVVAFLGSGDNGGFAATLTHDNTPYGTWRNDVVSRFLSEIDPKADSLEDVVRRLNEISPEKRSLFAKSVNLPDLPGSVSDAPSAAKQWYLTTVLTAFADEFGVRTFFAYAPREDVLRDLARDSDVEPIGVHGEGLFKLLQVLDSEGQLSEVKEQLALLGWFDDLSVASGVNPSSRALQIRDVFLSGDTPFDQRSANEGFLFVLLYACLLISKHTPRFFAVDNVDTALNPKLCAGAVRMFAELTRKYDRRVLLTAHNPGALDGLDLHDDEQRLFVVYRNTEGRTRARRILPADLPPGTEPVRLSEAFLRGYLGALPTNF